MLGHGVPRVQADATHMDPAAGATASLVVECEANLASVGGAAMKTARPVLILSLLAFSLPLSLDLALRERHLVGMLSISPLLALMPRILLQSLRGAGDSQRSAEVPLPDI